MDLIIDPDHPIEVYLLPENFDKMKDDITREMLIGALHTQNKIAPDDKNGHEKVYNRGKYTVVTTAADNERIVGRASFSAYMREKKIVEVFMQNEQIENFGFLVATHQIKDGPTDYGAVYVNGIIPFFADEEEEARKAASSIQPRVKVSSRVAMPESVTKPKTETEEVKEERRYQLMLQSVSALKKRLFDEKIELDADASKEELVHAVLEMEAAKKNASALT